MCVDKTSKQSITLFRPLNLINGNIHNRVIPEPADINYFLSKSITHVYDWKAIGHPGKWPY